jgi:glycosyltransferase involved in cell wall biosynthesis
MPQPQTISIALATCNGEPHLPEQLHSLACQTRPPDELIVCDDASQDQTQAIVRQFAAAAPFAVQWHRHEQRQGVAGNFQSAIERCTGDLIFLCDQDDVWQPRKLQRIEAEFADDHCLGVFHDLDIVDAQLLSLGRTQWQRLAFSAAERGSFARGQGFATLLRRNVVTGAGFAFRARCRELALPIARPWIHDEWIAIVLAACGGIAAVEEPLVRYRQHASQQIGGGASGLITQFAHARARMNADYFRDMVLRSQTLLDRLETLGDTVREPASVAMARRRLEHVQRRARLRQSAWRRGPGALREWLRGDYGRFAYGWRSLMQDLLL